MSPAGDELLGRELFRVCASVACRLRDHYVRGLVEHPAQRLKPDATPSTQADRDAHGLLLDHLARLTPGVPVLSEEGVLPPLEERLAWPEHWLVDPLDGTREFLDRTGQFSINLALVEGGRPILGAIFLPLSGLLYIGGRCQTARVSDGRVSHVLHPARIEPTDCLKLIMSRRGACQPGLRSWEAALRGRFPWFMREIRGSAWKFCRIAEGAAHCYPGFGATSEWDTAAGQALLESVGGAVLDQRGAGLRYNRGASLRNPRFIALAPALCQRLDVLPPLDC